MVRRRVYVQNMRYLRTNRIARRRLDGVYVAKRSIYSSFAGEVSGDFQKSKMAAAILDF